jgi:hypothetical protein
MEPRAPRAVDPSIPAGLEAIVLKCLEKERSARYDSARALAEDLDRFLAGEPVKARPTGLGYRLRKRARDPRVPGGAHRLQLDPALRAWDEEGGLSAEEGIDQRSSQSAPRRPEVGRHAREPNGLASGQRLHHEPLPHALGHGVRHERERGNELGTPCAIPPSGPYYARPRPYTLRAADA